MRVRTIVLVVALLAVAHVVGLAGPARAQTATCNPAAFGGITWQWVACRHEQHGHSQWNHGTGTTGHTINAYRWQAAAIRAYLRALQRAEERRELVSRWAGVADCESGGNWHINTGNGHMGGLQFSMGTWRAYGGRGLPHQRPAWYQATVADRVRVSSGLGHWPRCGSRYG